MWDYDYCEGEDEAVRLNEMWEDAQDIVCEELEVEEIWL
jgi:hypothetical protein